jgi:hypothetical protein
MKTKYILIGASALIAIYLIWQSEKSFFDDDNDDFRSGYYAGFLTPGPVTILVFAGLLASQV